MHRYYLADSHDRTRLSLDGTIEPAHSGTPQYFDSPDAAYHHPAAASLMVHSVPAAETVSGAPVGTDIDDAVMAADVHRAVGGDC